MIERLSLVEVEHIAFQLAREHLDLGKPIPDFSTRVPGILESCLKVPFQKFDGQSLYRTLVAKASILFYLMIKNHPFQDGNKRVATTALLVFLLKNGKWLKADWQEFSKFTIWIAASEASHKDLYIMAIEAFLKKHLVSRAKSQSRT